MMTTLLLAVALLWPLCVAAGAVWHAYRTPPAQRRYCSWLWVSAAWPALLLAYMAEGRWVLEAGCWGLVGAECAQPPLVGLQRAAMEPGSAACPGLLCRRGSLGSGGAMTTPSGACSG